MVAKTARCHLMTPAPLPRTAHCRGTRHSTNPQSASITTPVSSRSEAWSIPRAQLHVASAIIRVIAAATSINSRRSDASAAIYASFVIARRAGASLRAGFTSRPRAPANPSSASSSTDILMR